MRQLNYVKQHLTLPEESDPVGIILCSDKHDAVVKYALGGINARVFASKYLTNLPDEETLRREIQMTQRALETWGRGDVGTRGRGDAGRGRHSERGTRNG